MKKTIAVTGASGFVGRALCIELATRGYSVRAIYRAPNLIFPLIHSNVHVDLVGNINSFTDWTKILPGVECVIHCAGSPQIVQTEDHEDFIETNVLGTKNLAEQAVAMGVSRLIFLSSIKVNAESTKGTNFINSQTAVSPKDPYSISKWRTEQILNEIGGRSDLEIVIVRPPLIYGPGVKGNLARLLDLINSGIPLPLGAINNQRSFVFLDNLIDLLIKCSEHPLAAGRTLLVSDCEDISTRDLVLRISRAMGNKSCLFPVPVPLLCLFAFIFGRAIEVERLVNSLQIDCSETMNTLDWFPPFTVDTGIQKMTNGYMRHK